MHLTHIGKYMLTIYLELCLLKFDIGSTRILTLHYNVIFMFRQNELITSQVNIPRKSMSEANATKRTYIA